MARQPYDHPLAKKIAARRAVIDEADALFLAICELEGGDAMRERTEARADCFEWTMKRFRAKRERAWNETK
jgi:hypothetical protein